MTRQSQTRRRAAAAHRRAPSCGGSGDSISERERCTNQVAAGILDQHRQAPSHEDNGGHLPVRQKGVGKVSFDAACLDVSQRSLYPNLNLDEWDIIFDYFS